MKLRKLKQDLLRYFGYMFLNHLITILCKTLKIEKRNYEKINQLIRENNNFVVAFWHGTMLVPWYMHKKLNFAALVSQSKDGELLSRILNKWQYKIVRGSSNMGGKEALDILCGLAKDHYSILITPDGPTGPPHIMKAGAIITSKRSGIPLILLGTAYSKMYKLKSWDDFQIPKPFSKVVLNYSDPIMIRSELDFEEIDSLIKENELKLNQLQSEAEEYC